MSQLPLLITLQAEILHQSLISPLVVINAFSIADNLNFYGEDNDITIGGNLTLGNNVIFDPGTQTTTFNRSVSSAINLQNPTYDYALEFDRLIVDKPGATLNCISAGRASGITNPQSLFLTVNNELRVENGLFDYTDFRIRMNPGTDLILGRRPWSSGLCWPRSNEPKPAGDAYDRSRLR